MDIKYKDYLDQEFNISKHSIINYKDVNGGTEDRNIARVIKAIKEIIIQNTVIVTHGKIAFWIYQYILQNRTEYNKNKFIDKDTSIMCGLRINEDKIPGEIIYKPNNI